MSFGAIANSYDRLRPNPPEEAVDWLLPEHCQIAVDLAAGTGKLSRALLRKVARVMAVEPDERMAAVLRERSPGVNVVPGRGEAIPLPDASADGIFVSSAWHWMDPELAIPEIGRVLRGGGRFGVIWTGRDRQVGWLRDLDQLPELDQPRELDQLRELTRPGASASADPDAQGETRARRRHREVTLPEDGLFGNAQSASFSFTRTMTIADIVDMLATYSGVITASQQDRQAGLARARAALEKRFGRAGQIDVPMRSQCWRADRASRVAPVAS
jgi:SAM-dependent methyltransferase